MAYDATSEITVSICDVSVPVAPGETYLRIHGINAHVRFTYHVYSLRHPVCKEIIMLSSSLHYFH